MEQNADARVTMSPVVENKQNGGNGLKIATAIACVAAVCGIGFGIYGMIQSSQKDSQISDLQTQSKIDDEKEKSSHQHSQKHVAGACSSDKNPVH